MDLLEMLQEMDKARSEHLRQRDMARVFRDGGNEDAAERCRERARTAGEDWEKWFLACTAEALK